MLEGPGSILHCNYDILAQPEPHKLTAFLSAPARPGASRALSIDGETTLQSQRLL